MPLWLVFHPVGTFDDDASKQALAEDATKIYTESGLPAFYVVVNFIKLPVNDIWVGGRLREDKPFIRISIDHIALRMQNDDEFYKKVTRRFDKALKPHIADRGYDWEFHIDETERGLWKINGLIPPPYKSEAERLWIKQNRPVPWELKILEANI
jgi:hypothetical protein